MKIVLKLLMALATIAGVLALLIGKDYGYSRWWAAGLLAPVVLYTLYSVFRNSTKPQERYHITE